jgi:hypothetical protein
VCIATADRHITVMQSNAVITGDHHASCQQRSLAHGTNKQGMCVPCIRKHRTMQTRQPEVRVTDTENVKLSISMQRLSIFRKKHATSTAEAHHSASFAPSSEAPPADQHANKLQHLDTITCTKQANSRPHLCGTQSNFYCVQDVCISTRKV